MYFCVQVFPTSCKFYMATVGFSRGFYYFPYSIGLECIKSRVKPTTLTLSFGLPVIQVAVHTHMLEHNRVCILVLLVCHLSCIYRCAICHHHKGKQLFSVLSIHLYWQVCGLLSIYQQATISID